MHQWFGDSESPVDWNDIWLNEGPATYAETQVPFEALGATPTNPNSSETSLYNSWNASAPTSSLWNSATVASMTQASQLFGNPTYTRGSMTLAALRTAIGDVAYEEVMEQWQLRYAGESHRTADFIDLAEEISGRDLTAFFQTWIYTLGKPAWPAKFSLSLTGPSAPVPAGSPRDLHPDEPQHRQGRADRQRRDRRPVRRAGRRERRSACRPTPRWTAPP